MKKFLFILFLFFDFESGLFAQSQTSPDFTWGNASYFNLKTGEKIDFKGTEIKLLQIRNQYNQLQVGTEIIWLKVSRRTLPAVLGNLRIFVADNRNLKAIDRNKEIHGLLKKDALICVSSDSLPLLNPDEYFFPVSYSDGFLWSAEEDSYMFSYILPAERKTKGNNMNTGVDFDLQDARGTEKHWIVAIENSKVIWIENNPQDKTGKEASVLLESSSQPGIYYLYQHLFNKKIEVRHGQKLERGDMIGTVWGDENWGHLTFSVIRSDSVPSFLNSDHNVVNCFPQIFELYFEQSVGFSKYFTKGRIFFGKSRSMNGDQRNLSAFEQYSGKGWILGDWDITDKVDCAVKGNDGNARLWKILFKDSNAESTNPADFYDFEINVHNGVYRIRAKMGDILLPTWQKVVFEGIDAGIISNEKAGFNWTSEKVVKVNDGKLTVRIFVDNTNEKPAGIGEIVFQKAL